MPSIGGVVERCSLTHIQNFPTPRALYSNAKTNMIFFPMISNGYLPGITMKEGKKKRDATILENGVSLISWLSMHEISISKHTSKIHYEQNLEVFFKAMIYHSTSRS